MRGTAIRLLLPWLLPLLLLGGWAGVCGLALVPDWLLPSPWRVLETLAAYLGMDTTKNAGWSGCFWPDAAASLGRVACGYALAAIPAIPLGLLAGRCAWAERLLAPSLNGIRAVPGISWLPLVILWCGIGFVATVTLIALAAFFPVYFSAAAGAASVPSSLTATGRMLGLSRAAVFRRVVLPWAMPQLAAGLRVALGFSFAYLVLGELTGVPDGLGARIMDARMNGQADLLLCGIVCIACLGAACDRVLLLLLRRLPGMVR